MYPRTARLVLLQLAALGLGVVLAGCGGSAGEEAVALKRIAGPGFTFSVPVERDVARTPRSVTVVPKDAESPELESATRFPLVKRFRVKRWPATSRELDGIAEQLAKSLGGRVETRETVGRLGLRGRRYAIVYKRDGTDLRQRITFLLKGKTEYQLLCRWQESAGEPEACAQLETTFRPVPSRS